MYCGPELMAYNAMYAATTVAFSSYDSSMFSGYPVTSVGGIGPSSWMNAYQSNQTDLYSYQQGNHTEAFKRGKNLPRLSEAKEIVPNDQLDESTSEKVKHDTQKRENSLRYSKRKEEMRPQHASDSSHKNHHYSNKESIPRRRMDNDRRSYREYHGRSSSGGVECAYSSGSGRRGQDDTGPESRHSQKYSKPNGKDIYHERGQMTKYSNDDYEEDYHHSHKRKR